MESSIREKHTVRLKMVVWWLFLLILLPGCGLFDNSRNEEIPNLVNTRWQLALIEVHEGYVFEDYEERFWQVPHGQQYYIEFKENEELGIIANCETCPGSYLLTQPDSIFISERCFLDVVCERNIEYKRYLRHSINFETDMETLRLSFTEAVNNGTLHFARIEN